MAALVAERVEKTAGRISAKRLLPAARAAGYTGSARNFRRLVAEAKAAWRREHHRGRRPAVWSPGEHLVIDWGALAGLHVFCAVLAWSRFRFVRFATDERAATTLGMLAEVLRGGRRGARQGPGRPDGLPERRCRRQCRGPDRRSMCASPAITGSAPDFCEAADPESKGIVENLVGYAKTRPDDPAGRRSAIWRAANAAAAAWCAEVNARFTREICAVPAERLVAERDCCAPLPSLRPGDRHGWCPARSTGCRASGIGSARYSVPPG